MITENGLRWIGLSMKKQHKQSWGITLRLHALSMIDTVEEKEGLATWKTCHIPYKIRIHNSPFTCMFSARECTNPLQPTSSINNCECGMISLNPKHVHTHHKAAKTNKSITLRRDQKTCVTRGLQRYQAEGSLPPQCLSQEVHNNFRNFLAIIPCNF